MEDCRFIQNKRSGIGFQRAAEFVWIRDCYIEMTTPSTDQCVDFEPTGDLAPTNIIIEANILVHQTGTADVAISGVHSNDPTRRVTFAHNIVLGGEIFCTHVAELTMHHNLSGSDDVIIEQNMLVATGPCTQGVHVQSDTSAVNGISIRDNHIIVKGSGTWAAGILVSGNETHHVSAVGNTMRGTTNGIEFAGSGFRQTPVCALNRTEETVTNPLVGLASLPEHAVIVGGAASHGGLTPGSGVGRFLVGQGSPEGKVAGNSGDVYQRVDSGPGPRLFVKESDQQPNTGWSVK